MIVHVNEERPLAAIGGMIKTTPLWVENGDDLIVTGQGVLRVLDEEYEFVRVETRRKFWKYSAKLLKQDVHTHGREKMEGVRHEN